VFDLDGGEFSLTAEKIYDAKVRPLLAKQGSQVSPNLDKN
jgi:hypothetical protein